MATRVKKKEIASIETRGIMVMQEPAPKGQTTRAKPAAPRAGTAPALPDRKKAQKIQRGLQKGFAAKEIFGEVAGVGRRRGLPESVMEREEETISGPHGHVYVTKVIHRTPEVDIRKVLKDDPECEVKIRNNDFFTLLLDTSIQMDDPEKTRFVYASIGFDFSKKIRVLDYQPQKENLAAKLTHSGESEVTITPTIGVSATGTAGTSVASDTVKESFEIKAGPEAKLSGTYSHKTGYTLEIAGYQLLQYQGMLKNYHELAWEIYGDAIQTEKELLGKARHMLFTVIVQTPRDSFPEMTARVAGKVTRQFLFFPINGSIYFEGGSTVSGIS
ncbi:MAG: hypothetical protein GYA23_06605 [Methanomicrobiales archaeon]|nr:hypothetical protein [Methanomicrobiales archaeon]